jgi:RimJ/RimL family protein N-acetyltransferase
MNPDSPVLTGSHIRLEPLSPAHAEGLIAASSGDPTLYQWSAVPIGRDAVLRYIDTALALREAGTALAFATIRLADGVVIGSTRFFDIESWAWPAGHPRHGRKNPDVCEIGYTWLSHEAVRTAANTEAKLLMLTHAVEVWQMPSSVSVASSRESFALTGSPRTSPRATPGVTRFLRRNGRRRSAA